MVNNQPTGFRDLLNAMMKRRWFITAIVLGGFMFIMAGIFAAIIGKNEMEKLSKKAPNVEIHDKNKVMSLNSIFGEMWKPIFIKWLQDKVNLPIKTLYV